MVFKLVWYIKDTKNVNSGRAGTKIGLKCILLFNYRPSSELNRFKYIRNTRNWCCFPLSAYLSNTDTKTYSVTIQKTDVHHRWWCTCFLRCFSFFSFSISFFSFYVKWFILMPKTLCQPKISATFFFMQKQAFPRRLFP